MNGLIYIYVVCVLHVGGNLNNGSNAGVRYSNVKHSSSTSNVNIGSQQCLHNNKCLLTPALAEKYKALNGIGRSFEGSVKVKHMKRINNLYEQLYCLENLNKAYINARKGKQHYREVKNIDRDPEKHLVALQTILKGHSFKNSEYVVFKRNTGNKIREIYKLPFYPDRVVHHAIVQILQPIWMSVLIRNTFSTIPNRGIHDGVNKVKEALKDKSNTLYCLKLDVKKYYPSVNHNILESILRKKIKDEYLMELLVEIINSAPGIPIGNYISQWFGNLYLAYFDHFVKEELNCKYYFRYADDIVLLSSDKEYLWGCFYNIQEYLNNKLHLEVKSNYQIFPIKDRGLDFLGYRFWHTHTLVRKGIVKNFKRKAIKGKVTKQTFSSYYGWFKHADSYNLINKYFDEKV